MRTTMQAKPITKKCSKQKTINSISKSMIINLINGFIDHFLSPTKKTTKEIKETFYQNIENKNEMKTEAGFTIQ